MYGTSTGGYRCPDCKKIINASLIRDRDECTKFLLSLFLCPFGLFFLPYVHPKFKSTFSCPHCASKNLSL